MNKIKQIVVAGSAIIVTAAAHAQAAEPTDYSATLTSNLDKINTLWGTVASIMIGVALVVVGVRFFKKVK